MNRQETEEVQAMIDTSVKVALGKLKADLAKAAEEAAAQKKPAGKKKDEGGDSAATA